MLSYRELLQMLSSWVCISNCFHDGKLGPGASFPLTLRIGGLVPRWVYSIITFIIYISRYWLYASRMHKHLYILLSSQILKENRVFSIMEVGGLLGRLVKKKKSVAFHQIYVPLVWGSFTEKLRKFRSWIISVAWVPSKTLFFISHLYFCIIIIKENPSLISFRLLKTWICAWFWWWWVF